MAEKIILERPKPIEAKKARPYIRKEKNIIFEKKALKAEEKINDNSDDERKA